LTRVDLFRDENGFWPPQLFWITNQARKKLERAFLSNTACSCNCLAYLNVVCGTGKNPQENFLARSDLIPAGVFLRQPARRIQRRRLARGNSGGRRRGAAHGRIATREDLTQMFLDRLDRTGAAESIQLSPEQ